MQKSAPIAPKNNLSEQLKWLQMEKRSNALQHCLNSDAIQRYRTRQKPPQSTAAPISASELKQLISIGASKIKLFQQFSDPTTASALFQTPQSLYAHQSPTECIDLTAEEPKSFPIQTNEQSPTRLETDDTLFDQVDVDALVANYRQKQAGDSLNDQRWMSPKAQSPQPTRKTERPMSMAIQSASLTRQREMATRQNETLMKESDISIHEDLLSQIKRVRERLRGAREACDDASLYGDVPSKLQEDRIQLEKELEMLSQKFRQRSATTIDPMHRNPMQTESMERDATEQTSPIAMSPNVRAKMLQAKGVLRDIFGHTAFRPNQERVIHNAFEKRDIFVLMPTGGGKSLCYQLPACVDDGLTVVISPLVSLIQDQVQQLQALDVGVAYLNGEQDYETVQRPIVSELFSNQNRIKLLYVTPEKIASSGMLTKLFESLEKRNKLARFVIDEAHCISQWGHDFRKDYMNLGQLRRQFPSVRIMALTATANSQTEADIVKNLQLENPFITRSSFNRPNLTYDVRKKSSSFLSEIADFVRNHSQDSGIIYCLSKKDCEQTVEKLIKLLGYEGTKRASRIAFYHAGLEPEDRSFRHHEWSKGNVKLIVATIAFGMGINKPDVRYVIHYTIPQSVTHYYQESGRAGRDGYEAHCILYYSFADLSRRRKLITKDRDNLQHRNVHFHHLRRMIEYCENQIECRRTSLLEYFGEHFDSRECHATCDNCKNRDAGGIAEKSDVTDDCVAILNMVRKLQESCRSITLVQAAQLFLGQLSKGKERRRDELTSLEAFGRGKGRYERSEIERVIYHMILRQYLSEMDKKNAMGFTSTFLTSGSDANNLLRGERVHLICKTRRPAKSLERSDQKRKKQKKIVPEAASPVNLVTLPSDSQSRRIPGHHVEALAQLLKDWRASVCDNFNVMPYHILPTSGIAAIANAVPTTSTELSEIDGVGRIRVKKYGEAIISIVQSYLQKHNLNP